MKGHISWQWNEEVNNPYKKAPTQGKSAQSRVLCQLPRSVSCWVAHYASMEALTAEERPQASLGSWKWCHDKTLLLAIATSEIQNQCFTKAKGTPTPSQAHSSLPRHHLPDMVFLNRKLLFSRRKLCCNGKNIST